LFRTRNNLGLPIELLDSLRLVARSRQAYLDAIIDYNRAQFELFVALGQPPADFLARPVPPQLFAPPVTPSATPPPKK
jgi:outer membrane protein TolC